MLISNIGNNASGNHGLNDKVQRSSPHQVPGTAWTTDSDKFSGGTYNNAVVACMKTDGTLWMWGDGTYGQLAQNPPVSRSSPIQVPGTQWTHIKSGLNTLALKSDGTLWTWGYDNNGALGQNTNTVHQSSPVQIPGTAWDDISIGRNAAALATKTDGTLWAWGGNSYGNLGDNTILFKSSPTQIPGTQWDRISAAQNVSYISYATKTDGTLWAWGYNLNGALGQNDTTERSSPVQISGTSWEGIKSGYRYMVARKSDNTLWAWGYNDNGELGQNSEIYYSSPVQVPGTTWGQVKFVMANTMTAIKEL